MTTSPINNSRSVSGITTQTKTDQQELRNLHLLQGRKVPSSNKARIRHVFDTDMRGGHRTTSGKGAVKFYRALIGRASGMQGESYAIPLYDYDGSTPLPFSTIKEFVNEFIEYAESYNSETKSYDGLPVVFKIPRIGMALPQKLELYKLLLKAPSNCYIDARIIDMLKSSKK